MKLIFGSMLMLLALVGTAQAADRLDLFTRLNQIIDDVSNSKMGANDKYRIMNAVGREYGRMGFFVKRDTIVTTAGQETDTLNSDFAGIIQSAYYKHTKIRRVLPVIDRDSAFNIPELDASVISYIYVEEDGSIGYHPMPVRADTIIFLYHAYPDSLDDNNLEWDLQDYVEQAALFDVASDILLKLPTQEARSRAADLAARADHKLQRLSSIQIRKRSVK